MRMRKKLIGLLSLCLVGIMVAGMLPVTVMAAAHTNIDDHKDWVAVTEDNWSEVADGGNFYLNGDITGSLTVDNNVTVNLCLNSHALGGTVTVKEGGTLRISECQDKYNIEGPVINEGGTCIIEAESALDMTDWKGEIGIVYVTGEQGLRPPIVPVRLVEKIPADVTVTLLESDNFGVLKEGTDKSLYIVFSKLHNHGGTNPETHAIQYDKGANHNPDWNDVNGDDFPTDSIYKDFTDNIDLLIPTKEQSRYVTEDGTVYVFGGWIPKDTNNSSGNKVIGDYTTTPYDIFRSYAGECENGTITLLSSYVKAHEVTVINGVVEGGSEHGVGSTVHISADPPEGQEFLRWTYTGVDNLELTANNAALGLYSFVMPDAPVTFTAHYVAIPDSVDDGDNNVNDDNNVAADSHSGASRTDAGLDDVPKTGESRTPAAALLILACLFGAFGLWNERRRKSVGKN